MVWGSNFTPPRYAWRSHITVLFNKNQSNERIPEDKYYCQGEVKSEGFSVDC